MNIKIIECAQRSEAWFAARAGRVTGSRAEAIVARIKSGAEASTRRDYRVQLAVERITGRPGETGGYVNAEMQRGIDLEDKAREVLQQRTGLVVRQTGLVVSDELMVGCSLDGDIDDFKSIVEIKCPKQATHASYLRGGVLPGQYRAQIAHNLFVTGAKFCHFFSYDDRFPKGLDCFHIVVTPGDVGVAAYERDLRIFLEEVDCEQQALLALREAA